MNLLRILLYPFCIIWGAVLRVRHWLYDKGLLWSEQPNIRTICVGNLTMGGTGKTPLVLYIVDLLQDRKPAVLSRGFRRRTKGYLKLDESRNAGSVGDEPFMMYQKAGSQASFHVCENRVDGARIIASESENEVIILDDALQHRRIRPGLNILLTTYEHPFYKDRLFPCGTLRDLRYRKEVADIVLVTKCPTEAFLEENAWRKLLGLRKNQILGFTSMSYESMKEIRSEKSISGEGPSEGASVLLMTAIADPDPLRNMLVSHFPELKHASFPDHHEFTDSDINQALSILANFAGHDKWVVTTEKDLVRLRPFLSRFEENEIRIAVQPITVKFLKGKSEFEKRIKDYVGKD